MDHAVVKQPGMGRIYLIDYLKALCVILVVFTHYEWTDKATPFFVFFVSLAVPFFMIMTGYNFTASNLRKTDGTLKGMFAPGQLLPKVQRFLVPFLFIYIGEIIGMAVRHQSIDPGVVFYGLVTGGYGPGSYYVPLMLQMLVVFPLVMWVVRKWDKLGLVIVAAVNILYEVGIWQFQVKDETYRLLLFRYLMYIAFGCYRYFHRQEKLNRDRMLVLGMVGFVFLLTYTRGYRPDLFGYWTKTCMIASFFFIGMYNLIFENFQKLHLDNKLGFALSEIGKASYHIFLTQMVFYQLEVYRLYEFLPITAEVTLNICFCLVFGLTFYYGEQDLQKQKERAGSLWNWKSYLKMKQ